MSKIKIDNLEFSYKDDKVFSGLNFTLKRGKTLSIIGGTGSGKTTLLKILDGRLNYSGEVFINGVMVEPNNNELFRNIVCIFNGFTFNNEIVKDELVYCSKLYGVDYLKYMDYLNEFFGIYKLLKKKISDLSYEDKILLKIICEVMSKPMYIGLDDLLCSLSMRKKILLLNFLEESNVLLINVTSNMEEVLYTDYILCLYNGISAIDGKTLDVLKNEQLLKRLGFNLPFMVDLSIQLKDYGMINKVYLNNELMVNKLWK